MTESIFECEVLTPFFLGGADPRVKPELRTPSIRGAMRYWHRALIGGSTSIPFDDSSSTFREIRRLEEDLFGSTEKRSSVAILIPYSKTEILTFQKEPAIQTSQGKMPAGKDYLLWSMAASGRREDPQRYQPPREYINPGTKFTVKMRSLGNEKALEKATSVFWLVANLGALGARANRGAGSFIIQKALGVMPNSPVFKVCSSVVELEKYLSESIQKSLNVVCGTETRWRDFSGELTAYDILSPSSAEIWVVTKDMTGWNSYVDALNGIGEKLRDFRSHKRPQGIGKSDHNAVLSWLSKGGVGPKIQRSVFGLPVPFGYSGGGARDVIISEVSDRRASPLHIHVTRLGTGKYVGVFALFKSKFIESGKQLQLQSRKWKAPPPDDYEVIQHFIETFPVRRKVAYD